MTSRQTNLPITGIPDQLRRVFGMLSRASKVQFGGLLVLMFLLSLLEMLGIGLVLPLLGLIINPLSLEKLPFFGTFLVEKATQDTEGFFLTFLVFIVIFFIIKNLAMVGLNYLQFRFISRKISQYTSSLLGFYLRQPYDFHITRNSSELLRNLSVSVPSMFSLVLLPLLILLQETMLVGGAMIILFWAEPIGTLLALTVLALGSIIIFFALRHRMVRWGEELQHLEFKFLQWIQQGLGAFKEAKVMGRENYFDKTFRDVAFRRVRPHVWLRTSSIIPRQFLEAAGIACVLILALWAIRIEGRSVGELLPTLGLFTVAAFRLLPSMNRLVLSFGQLKEGQAAIQNIVNDLADHSFEDMEAAQQFKPVNMLFSSELRMENISYHYPESEGPALSNVSLYIKQGESIGLVGPSGAGKSTLVNVILGLLQPMDGKFLVDGINLFKDEDHTRAWQSKIGYVPQKIFLLDDTLSRNIAFGIPDDKIDMERIQAVLLDAHLTDVVAELPEGLDTILGEDGMRLSGGQRQRVGIARALYHDPSVLILDEATSALDNETEKEINRAIDELRGCKTILIIAHRLSTVHQCDRLLFMKRGIIVDEGTFNDLMDSNSDFHTLAMHGTFQGNDPEKEQNT
jgi:ATP-binding cassette, subfamily B, bacterial PglK